jgi:hypothetical protein
MRRRLGASRGKRIGSVAALLVITLASCGGSARMVLLPPAENVAPGHDSPQAAVAGFMSGFAKNDVNAICEYVAPAQTAVCKQTVAQSGGYTLTPWRLGYSMVRGNKAIVVVVAEKMCAAKACISNADVRKGLPPNQRNFEHAFEATVFPLPANSLVRLRGKWYVALA